MKKLQEEIEAFLDTCKGRWSLILLNHPAQQRIEFNPAMQFPAASMIKLPVMYELVRQAAAGSISLNELITIKKESRVGGAGILKELRPDIPITIGELITLMIILSDNTATNIVIDMIGMDSVNRSMKHLGLTGTCLCRYMMDFAAASAGKENTISAADFVLLLSHIYDGTVLPAHYNRLMIDILCRQQIRDKLPFFWPESAVIAHKTGTLPGVEHDGGILFLPNGPYLACILTADLPSNAEGIQAIAYLGKIIYENLTS